MSRVCDHGGGGDFEVLEDEGHDEEADGEDAADGGEGLERCLGALGRSWLLLCDVCGCCGQCAHGVSIASSWCKAKCISCGAGELREVRRG